MSVYRKYWDDSYLCDYQTNITSVNENEITLKETIIFSFSGGQQSDLGYINEYQVLSSRIEDDDIYYTIDLDHNLKVGDIVALKIDWDTRLNIMKNHLAIELVVLLMEKKYPDIIKIGANVSATKARADFIWQGNISSELEYLQREIDKVIEADLIINRGFLDDEHKVRYWVIEGFNIVHCCGTHIRSTKELNKVIVKRKGCGLGKERIEVTTL